MCIILSQLVVCRICIACWVRIDNPGLYGLAQFGWGNFGVAHAVFFQCLPVSLAVTQTMQWPASPSWTDFLTSVSVFPQE